MTPKTKVPAGWHLKEIVQNYLATVPHKLGETVQLGWFVFRIADDSSPPEIESLDFRKMASFTKDFSAAEHIRILQTEVLARHEARAEHCTLDQWALVSRSYVAGCRDAFIERQRSSSERDSGWYVGVLDDPLDLDDEGSFDRRSLYELTIADERMAPYWLLPVRQRVILSTHISL